MRITSLNARLVRLEDSLRPPAEPVAPLTDDERAIRIKALIANHPDSPRTQRVLALLELVRWRQERG